MVNMLKTDVQTLYFVRIVTTIIFKEKNIGYMFWIVIVTFI